MQVLAVLARVLTCYESKFVVEMSDNAPAASGQSTLSVRPVLFGLPLDGVLCFATRSLRMLAYGAVAPVLVLYVLSLGYTTTSVGVLLTCILLGDLAVTLVLSTRADAFGRRKTLVVGSGLKILAGVAFASSSDFRVLLLAGSALFARKKTSPPRNIIIPSQSPKTFHTERSLAPAVVGVISTSGGECGPFLAIEQAALTDSVLASRGTTDTAGAGDVAVMFGYFNAIGCLFQAMGALLSGFTVQLLEQRGVSSVGAYRVVFMAYASTGLTMALLYGSMSKAVEVKGAPSVVKGALGLRRRESVHVVARLSAFFALDALGGAFTVQTYVAFFFSERWGFSPEKLGVLLMAANLVAGLSGIAASYFVKRFGAMLTMIVTHLPSNVLLLFVPLMPTANSTAASALRCSRARA